MPSKRNSCKITFNKDIVENYPVVTCDATDQPRQTYRDSDKKVRRELAIHGNNYSTVGLTVVPIHRARREISKSKNQKEPNPMKTLIIPQWNVAFICY